jgi:hypothetical protein
MRRTLEERGAELPECRRKVECEIETPDLKAPV